MDSAGVGWSELECVSERAWGYHDGVPQGMCDMKFVLTRSTAEGAGGVCPSRFPLRPLEALRREGTF